MTFYLEHIEAKKITVKRLKIHTFRDILSWTQLSNKILLHHAVSIILMASKIAEKLMKKS